jgi:hypothetical protein
MRSGSLLFVFSVLGALIVGLLAAGLLVGRGGWIGPILVLLGLLYLGHVLLAPTADLATAGFAGVALLLIGELSQWSFDGRLHGRYAGRMHVARGMAIASLVALGGATVLVSELAIGLPVSGGLATLIIGMAAFAAFVGLVSIVAVRRSGAPGR